MKYSLFSVLIVIFTFANAKADMLDMKLPFGTNANNDQKLYFTVNQALIWNESDSIILSNDLKVYDSTFMDNPSISKDCTFNLSIDLSKGLNHLFKDGFYPTVKYGVTPIYIDSIRREGGTIKLSDDSKSTDNILIRFRYTALLGSSDISHAVEAVLPGMIFCTIKKSDNKNTVGYILAVVKKSFGDNLSFGIEQSIKNKILLKN